jgi:hypothetical protein
VFLNLGKGTFFRKQTITGIGNVVHQLAATGVNGDGIQDLVNLRLFLKQDLEYRLGRGDGTFGAPHPDGQNQAMTTRPKPRLAPGHRRRRVWR